MLFDKAVRFCFFLAGFILMSSFSKQQTDGFSIPAIASNRVYNEEYATRPLSFPERQTLQNALNQHYVYFGRGGQSFVFFSKDGQYVLKFFQQRHFRPNWLLNHLPLPKFLQRYRFKKNWKRQDKLHRDFFSYKVAFDDLLDITGLIYVHLNPTENIKKRIHITDPLHISHQIDLDQFDFIIQNRAENTLERIDRCMREKNIDQAKQTIQTVLNLVSMRCQRGYQDRDPNLCTNCGFLGEKAIKLDVGRFGVNEEMKKTAIHNEEMIKVAKPLEKWLLAFYPELIDSFHSALEETLL